MLTYRGLTGALVAEEQESLACARFVDNPVGIVIAVEQQRGLVGCIVVRGGVAEIDFAEPHGSSRATITGFRCGSRRAATQHTVSSWRTLRAASRLSRRLP